MSIRAVTLKGISSVTARQSKRCAIWEVLPRAGCALPIGVSRVADHDAPLCTPGSSSPGA